MKQIAWKFCECGFAVAFLDSGKLYIGLEWRPSIFRLCGLIVDEWQRQSVF